MGLVQLYKTATKLCRNKLLHHYLQQLVILKIFGYTWKFTLKDVTFHPNSESHTFLAITLASDHKDGLIKDITVFTDLLVPVSQVRRIQ